MKTFARPFFGMFAATLGALAMVAVFHITSWGKDAGPVINVESTPVNREAVPATSFAPVIKKAAPSVVNIYSTRTVRIRPMDPAFRRFFSDEMPQDEQPGLHREEGLGSGVIISPDGYILTANHVVEGADEIKVAIGDDKKNEYTPRVVGTDPQTDIAVLKIDAKDLSAITLADSDQLQIGDIVLAIGNPFNIGQTVTTGIISALGRSGLHLNTYENFIQTDAAINPGNSGGALVDAEGRLVGINTAIKTSSDGNEGIGFAVPINMARHVMERLIADGKVTRGFLGVTLQDLDANLASGFNLSGQNGVLVDDVVPNQAAAKAGIQSGDVIVAFNGKDATDANSLILAISDTLPGSKITLKLIHNGSEKTVTATLREKASPAVPSVITRNNSKPDSSKTDALDGVTVEDLDQAVRRQLTRIARNDVKGALVADVAQNSNSAEAGLRPGDIIEEINHQPVAGADDAMKLCNDAKGRQILLKVCHIIQGQVGTRYLSVDNTVEK